MQVPRLRREDAAALGMTQGHPGEDETSSLQPAGGVQSHDILYTMSRDTLCTPALAAPARECSL